MNKTVKLQGHGFTLMELLISVAIVAILTAIGVVSYSSVNKRARDAKRKSDIEQVRSALEIYRNDNEHYPGTAVGYIRLDTLDAQDGNPPLVPTYLPRFPMDPRSTSSTPISYYYSPKGSGAPPYYAYCLCGAVENAAEANNSCPASMGKPATTNYCVYSP